MISILLVSYALLNIGMYTYQERLLFFPGDVDIRRCPGSLALDMKYKEKKINNQTVRYLFKDNNAEIDFIIFHGNAATVCNRLDFAYRLKNVNIYLYEYPGYGKDNNEEISEENFYHNAKTFMQHYYSQGHDHKTYLYGESIGTGVATYIAAQYENIDKLFLQSPYTSITDVAFDQYPFMPISLLLKNPFEQVKNAKKVKAQVYAFYDNEDKVIDPQISKEQFKHFKSQKKIFKYKGFGHNLRYQNHKLWEDITQSLQ